MSETIKTYERILVKSIGNPSRIVADIWMVLHVVSGKQTGRWISVTIKKTIEVLEGMSYWTGSSTERIALVTAIDLLKDMIYTDVRSEEEQSCGAKEDGNS